MEKFAAQCRMPGATVTHCASIAKRQTWPDASARGLQLAFRALRGEPDCGSVLGDPDWGMEAVMFRNKPLSLSRPLGTHVMENLLFKAAFPGVVHAQTALECAIKLHPIVTQRVDEIERIDLWSHETAIRITSKSGTLHNPADRDHCLQYMVAMGLLHGTLTEDDFTDNAASDSRIDTLRGKMRIQEDPSFTAANINPEMRASPNGIQIHFRDGTATPRSDIYHPIGHASRRDESLPLLMRKLRHNLATCLSPKQSEAIMKVFEDRAKFCDMSVKEYVDLYML
jgi:2-methylcitrate dehydratase